MLCLLPCTSALAENYELTTGGSSKATATAIRVDREYAAQLVGSEVLYFKFTTPNKKGFYDFYAKNINISTHSWAGDSQFRVSICDAREEVLADYRLTYGSDNKRDGVTPLVTLNPNTVYYIRIYNPQEGIGNYTFTMSHHRNSISQAAVQVKNTYTYTGKAITPGVKVVYGSTVLKKGKDYSVAYSNNKKPGIATAKITGIGAYKGSYKATFKIRPVQAKIQKLSVKKRKITVKIAQDKNASGYEIQYAANSSFKSAKKISVNGNKAVTKQTPSLKASTKYFVRVRSYKKVGSQKITSVWSAPKSIRTKK